MGKEGERQIQRTERGRMKGRNKWESKTRLTEVHVQSCKYSCETATCVYCAVTVKAPALLQGRRCLLPQQQPEGS